MIVVRGQIPAAILVDLVDTLLKDVWHRWIKDEGGREQGFQVVDVGLDEGSLGHLEGIESEGRDAFIPYGEEPQCLESRRPEELSILRLRRLDNKKRNRSWAPL